MNGPSEINDKCFPCSIETRQPFCSNLAVPFMYQIITLNVKVHHYVLVKTQCPVTIQTTSETLF